jgi:hypothetical protein
LKVFSEENEATFLEGMHFLRNIVAENADQREQALEMIAAEIHENLAPAQRTVLAAFAVLRLAEEEAALAKTLDNFDIFAEARAERYRLAWTSARRRAIALKLSNQVRAGQLMGSRIVGEQHKTERDEARAEVVRLGKKVEALIEQNRQIQHRWAEDTARANEAARLSADARDHAYDLRAELAELRERTRNVEHDRDVITAWALRLLDEHGVEVPLAADIYQAIAKYIRALKDDIATYRHAEDRAVQAREEYAREAERLGAQCQHLVNRANEFRAARDHLLEAGKAWLDEGFPNTGATAEHRLASAVEDVIANVPQGQSMWVMTEYQAEALRALLGLVHYDDLASSWLAMLPAEIHPAVGVVKGLIEGDDNGK